MRPSASGRCVAWLHSALSPPHWSNWMVCSLCCNRNGRRRTRWRWALSLSLCLYRVFIRKGLQWTTSSTAQIFTFSSHAPTRRSSPGQSLAFLDDDNIRHAPCEEKRPAKKEPTRPRILILFPRLSFIPILAIFLDWKKRMSKRSRKQDRPQPCRTATPGKSLFPQLSLVCFGFFFSFRFQLCSTSKPKIVALNSVVTFSSPGGCPN